MPNKHKSPLSILEEGFFELLIRHFKIMMQPQVLILKSGFSGTQGKFCFSFFSFW